MATTAPLPPPADEARLVRAARGGDEAAWAGLIAAQGPSLYALCRRLDADPDDAYQEVWARIVARLDHFDARQGSFGPWARTVARRLLIDRHRHQRSRGTVLAHLGTSEPPPVADRALPADTHLHLRRRQAQLENALQRLSPGQRRAVVLHHLEGLELTAIADQEDAAVGTIKSRLHRARARLVRMLGGEP